MTHEALRRYYIREAEGLLLNNPELARGLGGFDFVELYADARITEFELNHSPQDNVDSRRVDCAVNPSANKRKKWGVLSI